MLLGSSQLGSVELGGVTATNSGFLGVSVSDSITLTENIVISVSDGEISVSDSITLTENLSDSGQIIVSVYDGMTVSENLKIELRSNVSIFDAITITESVIAESFKFSPSLSTPVGDLRQRRSIGNLSIVGRPIGVNRELLE